MAEYDRIGPESFFKKYGYGPAKSYFLSYDGRLYASKAIDGVAIRYQDPGTSPLTSASFSGGKPVMKKLRTLGFEIVVTTQKI